MSSDFIHIDGMGQFFTEIDKKLAEHPKLVIRNLAYIGECATAYARSNHDNNWTDRTGNLRSSIGYVVLHDGKPVVDARAKHIGGGKEGVERAKELLEELSKKFPKGYVLIVCAGMNYASYVEDVHGKDVVTGARLIAKRLIQQLLK